MPVAASPFDRFDDTCCSEAQQQLLEQHSQFQPGQIGTQAVVHTLPKAQMRVGLSGYIELVGAVEDAAVAVGRSFPDLYLLPRLDRLPAEPDRTGGGTPLGR